MLKDTFIYGGAAIVSKASAFISFPLLAQNLSKTDYGFFDYSLTLLGLLAVLFVFGQDSAIARYFYENENRYSQKQLISQSLFFQFLCLTILLPVLWFHCDFLSDLFLDSSKSTVLIKLILLQIPFILLINFSRNILKWTFSRNQFLVMSIGPCFLQVCLFYFAVKFYSSNIKFLLQLTLLSNLLFGLLGLCYVKKWLTYPSGFERLREMLPFAIPIGIISVAGLFLPTFERTLVLKFLGGNSLGDYAVATKVALLVGLAINAFQTAWGPFSLSIYKQRNAIETYNMVLKIFCAATCIATLCLTLIAEPLVSICATDRYSKSVLLVFPLAMGLSIQGISWITEIGIGISKRSHLNLYSSIGNIVVTVSGILVFAPVFGLLGVSLVVMVSFLIKSLIASWLAQKAYPMQWHYQKPLILVIFTMLFGLLSLWFKSNFNSISSILVLLVGVVINVLVGWFVMLNTDERKCILSVFTKKLFLSSN